MSLRAEVNQDWSARLGAAGLERIEDLLDAAKPHGLRGSLEVLSKPGLAGRERWRWSLDAPGDAATLFVKRYARPGLRAQWDRAWRQAPRRSRAWWEFAQSRRLAEAHVGAARAVAYAERMCGPYELGSAVLFQAARGEALDRAWRRLADAGAPITRGAARRDLIVRLARFVAAFHNAGVCHRDLYLCHVFADLDAQAERPPRFELIDLGRAHRPAWRRTRWIIKDLAQLDASARQARATRADRLRFLCAYLGLAPRAARLRWYARRVARKSDWILAREARKRLAR